MNYHSQQGVVLIMALLYLSILALLVMAAFESGILETQMATHTTDSIRALQNAESALVAGENAVQITETQGSGAINSNASYQFTRRPETDCGVVYYQIDATGKYLQAVTHLEAILLMPESNPPQCPQDIPPKQQLAWQQIF